MSHFSEAVARLGATAGAKIIACHRRSPPHAFFCGGECGHWHIQCGGGFAVDTLAGERGADAQCVRVGYIWKCARGSVVDDKSREDEGYQVIYVKAAYGACAE